MDGSQVWDAWQRGEIAAIRNYCETDVVNTYLLFLRFQLMRGALDRAAYDAGGRSSSAPGSPTQTSPHWKQFAQAWPTS